MYIAHIHVIYIWIQFNNERFYFLSFSDVLYAQTTCQQTVTLIENDNFSCLCAAATAHFSPTAIWVKDGRFLGEPSGREQKLFLRNVSKDDSGIYICRAQLHSLIGEKSVEVIVQCKCFWINLELLINILVFFNKLVYYLFNERNSV